MVIVEPMKSVRYCRAGRSRPGGFSLVDLLIGIAIGLLGTLAVSKVLIDFNARRNTTVQLSEAQNNGIMAIYLIERDLGMAGYGMMQLQNCNQIQWYYTIAQGAFSPIPVTIIDGGATGSDAIRIQYAYTRTGAPAASITQDQASFVAPYSVASIAGYAVGDLIVANSSNVCTLGQVTAVNNVAFTISHDQDATTPANTPYNPGTGIPNSGGTAWYADATGVTQATVNNLIATAGSQLVDLGPQGSFVRKTFSVGASGLNVSSFPGGAAAPLVDNILLIKAEYGRDTNGDGAVDVWSSAASFTPDNTTAAQIVAIRIGVVAKSPLLEKDTIPQPNPLTVLPDTTGGVANNAVTYTIPTTSSADHFRYRAYSTIVPLRNVIWSH